VVLLRRFGGGELRGIVGGAGFYVKRTLGESEEALCLRAEGEAEKLGGFLVIAEDRVGPFNSDDWITSRLPSFP
jgi:hypothetical protein